MENAICKRAATVQFWDGYAKWYKLWMEHNSYHDLNTGRLRKADLFVQMKRWI